MVPMPGSSSVVSRALVDVRRGGLDPLPVGVRAGAVVERAAGQAVAVGDLDRVDAGGVERGDDPADVVGRRCGAGSACMPSRSVTSWMKSCVGSCGHLRAACAVGDRARPMRSAAEVMMSRLPA